MSQPKKLRIRNSTAEFLVFTSQAKENGIEVRVEGETVWLTQKLIAALFEVDVRTVSEHLQNIFANGELKEQATLRNFRTVQKEGDREVTRNVAFYNLDAIISVGYRVNSLRATQFRQWATGILRDFAIRGYVLDKERLKNGSFFNRAYFENLLAEIRAPKDGIPTMSKPGGFSAISRWLSEARAIPPDSRRNTIRIPEGCQP